MQSFVRIFLALGAVAFVASAAEAQSLESAHLDGLTHRPIGPANMSGRIAAEPPAPQCSSNSFSIARAARY